MANSFSFNKIKRKYFNVQLKNNKTYLVQMPEKGTFERLIELKNTVGEEDSVRELYNCVAMMISNNKQGYKVTAKDIAGYTIEEIMEFIKAYMGFVKGITEEKN